MTEYYMLGFLTRKDGVRNDRVLYVRIHYRQKMGFEMTEYCMLGFSVSKESETRQEAYYNFIKIKDFSPPTSRGIRNDRGWVIGFLTHDKPVGSK